VEALTFWWRGIRGCGVLVWWWDGRERGLCRHRYELKRDLGLNWEAGVGDVKLMCGCGKGS
jgi:hypothetical protein